MELLQAKCGCSYSALYLTSPVLQCPSLDPDTSDEVTFRARVQDGGESPLSSEEVISYLEESISQGSILLIQGLLLSFSSEYNVTVIEGLNDPPQPCSEEIISPSVRAKMDASEDDEAFNTTTILISSVLGVVVLLLLVVVLVALVCVVMNSHHNKNLCPKSIHIHQTSGEPSSSLGPG